MSSWQLKDISCYFNSRTQTQAFWALESFKLIHQLRTQAAHVEVLLKRSGILRLTRERLKNVNNRLQQQIAIFESLLRPLGWESVNTNNKINSFHLKDGSSFLVKNIDNFFRDWCWGEKENLYSFEEVKNVLKDVSVANEELVVLGSGASRLAFDLHQFFPFHKTYAVDYNPLFQLLVQKITKGETLNLNEFPIVPSSSQDFALERTLKAPQASRDGFECILADICEDQFVRPTAKVILTPWLIDVVSLDLVALIRKINSAPPTGGVWINHGPLGFNSAQMHDYYSFEEVNYIIEKCGFKILNSSYCYLPYLQSPSSNSHRTEKVYTFLAEKTSDEPKVFDWEVNQKGLPKWISDTSIKIDIPVKELRLEEAYSLNAKIARLLKQHVTFEELLDLFAQEIHLEKSQIRMILQEILLSFHKQSILNPLDHK